MSFGNEYNRYEFDKHDNINRKSNKFLRNDHFNKIVKWFENEYSIKKGKKLIIIGYNKQWKKKVNMGKINNRKFYQIPYCKLLNKLT